MNLNVQKASRSAHGGGGKSFKTTKSMATKFEPPTHPAMIITSAFTASHIEKLKKKLQENYIAYGMQTSKKKLNRPPGAPTNKNFIIVDDSQGPQILQGQFIGMNMCRVDYPKKNNLDNVIQKFDKYIGLGKETVKRDQAVEQIQYPSWEENQQMEKVGKTVTKGKNIQNIKGGYGDAFNGVNSKLKIENLENVLQVKQKFDQFRDVFKKSKKNQKGSGRNGSSSSNSSRSQKKSKKKQINQSKSKNSKQIALKSVKQYGQFQQNIEHEKRSLFILKTEKQSQRFKEYVQQFEGSKNKRIKVVKNLQEYYKSCYESGEGENCLLLSPNVAFKQLHKFRNVKDVYIYGDDPKFCAQLVKGNIKNAAMDPNQMDKILISQNFNRNQAKQFIAPMRKAASKMNIPDEDQKPLKLEKQKDKEKDKEKEKDKDKPSLFGRFVDFVKGKSKDKDKDKEKQKDKKEKQKQKEKEKRTSSSSSSSSSSFDSANQNKKKNKKKQVQRAYKPTPSIKPAYLQPTEENLKGMISLGQIGDKNKSPEDEGLALNKNKKVTVIRIKSNNKITNSQLPFQKPIEEPDQNAYKVGGVPKEQPGLNAYKVGGVGGVPKEQPDQNAYKVGGVGGGKPIQISKPYKQNDQVNFQIPKPPILRQSEGNRPKYKDEQPQQSYGFQTAKIPKKQDQKDRHKVGNPVEKGEDYKELRFNLQKQQEFQNDMANYKIPNKKKNKKKKKRSNNSSSSSSSSSQSSSSQNMAVAAKVPKKKQKQQRKKKQQKKSKQSSDQVDVYFEAKPQFKLQKDNISKKLSHKVQDITEQHEHHVEIDGSIPYKPQYDPSGKHGMNNKRLKNQQRVAPAFCEQNPSESSENQHYFNKNNKRSKPVHQKKRRQSEQNYGYHVGNKRNEFSQTAPPTGLENEFGSFYPNSLPNKLLKTNSGNPKQRNSHSNQYHPYNPSYSPASKPHTNENYNFKPNHPYNLPHNPPYNTQQQVRPSQPNQPFPQLNGPPQQQMYQPQNSQPFNNPSYQPPLYAPSKPLGQPVNQPHMLGGLNPVGPSNDNFNRPISYSTHTPKTGLNLPFDQTKYDKTIENGVTVYRPKRILFQLGVMPATVIGETPSIVNPKPGLSLHIGNLNPNPIFNSRESPNKQYHLPKTLNEQKPLKQTASTYFKKLSDAPLVCSIPTPKSSPFSTYEYFMNNNQLPIYSPASPRKQPHTQRFTTYKSVLVCDKPIESEIDQPIYQCDCKFRNTNPQPKHKNSEYEDPEGKKPKPRKNKQNVHPCHVCENPTKLKKNLTKTKQAFYNLDSDDSCSRNETHRKNRNAKSLSRSAQQFNSSILDNISSRVNRKPGLESKNYSVLYLVNSKLNPKIMKELFQISDESDTIQTYPHSQPQKMIELMKKGQNIFDFILVFGANSNDKNVFDSSKLSNTNHCKGNYYVQYDENALQSNIFERVIILRIFSDLFILLNGLLNNKVVECNSSGTKSSKIGYIYFKDFNFPIRRIAKQLKTQYPNCQVRRYFGLLDLPTKLPFSKNETTIILLDEVSFNQISAYCSQQQKQNPNILKICIPKSRQAMRLCQKSPTSERIVWLTQQQLDNWEFLAKRIQKRIF